MKGAVVSIAALVALSLPAVCSAQSSPWERGLDSVTTERSRLYVETLAADRFGGRRAGSAGLRAASKQIVRWIEETGAVPFAGKSYFQRFSEARISELGAAYRYTDGFTVRNILAMIEGVNPDEYVIVGAHYDHLGTDYSLPGDDKLFNGADDNASGVAGVLQIARAFAASGERPQRTVVFALWDAEEEGLVGSNCFGLTFDDMDKVRAYVNLDMIGRDESGAEGKVMFFSTDSLQWAGLTREYAASYTPALEPVTDPEILAVDFKAFVFKKPWDDDGEKIVLRNNSDYRIFQRAGVPVYMVTTGLHDDYHGLGDEAGKIDYPKMTDIAKLSFLTVYRLANH